MLLWPLARPELASWCRRRAAGHVSWRMSVFQILSDPFRFFQVPGSVARSVSSTPSMPSVSTRSAPGTAASAAVVAAGVMSMGSARSRHSKKTLVSLRARGGEEDTRVCIPLEELNIPKHAKPCEASLRILQELRNTDVDKVGGKSASLGEMISQLSDVGVPVPGRTSRHVFCRGLSLRAWGYLWLSRWLQYHLLCLQRLFGQRPVS